MVRSDSNSSPTVSWYETLIFTRSAPEARPGRLYIGRIKQYSDSSGFEVAVVKLFTEA